MTPDEVPADLVEKAAEDVCSADPSWRHHYETDDFPCSACRDKARLALAAVLPEIQAQALREAALDVPGSNRPDPIDPYDQVAEWLILRADDIERGGA